MAHNGALKSENKLVDIITRLFLVIIVIVLLASLVMFIDWLNKPGNFAFKKVELVNRLENQESRELQKIAAKALNGGFFSLNVDEFRAELLDKLPWVRSVSVRKIWPDKLLIEIAEYQPVVRWQSVDSGYVQQQTEGSLATDSYQLLSQDGIIFEPMLTDVQKDKFNMMALLSGPEISAKNVLTKCVEINKNIKKLGLGIKYCGMNKRRTWRLGLTSLSISASGITQNDDMDIKLGKENIMHQLERFVQVFSGKLKRYLSSIEYVDLRYSNGFSVKWNTNNILQNSVQDTMQSSVHKSSLQKNSLQKKRITFKIE